MAEMDSLHLSSTQGQQTYIKNTPEIWGITIYENNYYIQNVFQYLY